MFRTLVAIAGMGASLAAGAQCTKDTDCRDPRICERGTCVYPEAAKDQSGARKAAKEPGGARNAERAVPAPASRNGEVPDQIRLTVNDGKAEQWIMFERNGERVTRSPGLEALGSASGTMYLAEGAQIRVTASLIGGSVPPGHRIHVYWQGYPRDEDFCNATSGTECAFSRRLHTLSQGPNSASVCAALDYLSGGTNRGLGAVCISLNMRQRAAAAAGAPNQIKLTVSEGRNEGAIVYDRTTQAVTRSPNLEKLGSASGTMHVAQGAQVRLTASLPNATVPAGHRIHMYWQGHPNYEDVCNTTSGSECSILRRLHTLNQGPNGPSVCAAMDYLSGGTNQGLPAVCITLFMR